MQWKEFGKKEYSLQGIVAPAEFKTYEELQKRLEYVLGKKGTPRYQDSDEEEEDNTRGSFKPDFSSRRSEESDLPEDLSSQLNSLGSSNSSSSSDEDEDDALSYFQRLAES